MDLVDLEGQQAEQQDWWSYAPTYDPSVRPSVLAEVYAESTPEFPGNFFRSAQWCPDGSCILTTGEDQVFQRHDISPESDLSTNAVSLLAPAVFPQPSSILSSLWYPSATPSSPATFCYLAAVRAQPVKLLDAASGRLRASYRIVDHRERFVAPWGMAFDGTAERLYCGIEDAVEVFDVSRPGDGKRMHTSPTKKSKSGQKGIIAALAFSPTSPTLLAAGSLSSSLALYSTSSTNAKPEHILRALPGGVTQLAFHPRGHVLYAAFRGAGSGEVWAWDVRNMGGGEMARFARSGSGGKGVGTNQRMGFGVEPWGRWLVAGGEDGRISVFDIADSHPEAPVQVFDAHNDAIGSTSFHPHAPLLLSISGSRHFPSPSPPSSPSPPISVHSSSSSDYETGSDEEEEERAKQTTTAYVERVRRARPKPRDASMRVWKFGKGREGAVGREGEAL